MNTKKLEQIYNRVVVKSGNDTYFSKDIFLDDCKALLLLIKKGSFGSKIHVAIKPARSGMSRKFYFERWITRTLNIVNSGTFNLDFVQSYGCGMDMLWHELYRFCETVATRRYIEKHGLNGRCSDCTYILG